MQSDCDLCGTNTFLRRYVIEGAEVNACPSCGKFGKPLETQSKKPGYKTAFRGSKPGSTSTNNVRSGYRTGKARSGSQFRKNKETFLKEDFGNLIRQTRERLGLTRKEVCEPLFIRENLLARIETGNFRPSDELIKKLEKTLEISLIEQTEEKTDAAKFKQKTTSNQTKSLTLGDFAHIRKKKSS
ncbi:MAG: multiprotein bridging factor aMBF1 [Candidatus Hodarchaeales archaeon]|jgi:putative transcription factor